MRLRLMKIIAYTFFSITILAVVILSAELVFRFMPVYNREWMDYNPITVWRMKAGNESIAKTREHAPFKLKINEDGFNDIEHTVSKNPSVKRIMVIGDSYTAGLDYPIEEIFTGILRQKLNKEFPDKYEILNCAVSGWALEQQFLYFIKEGKRYKPDYVILVAAPNDIRESYIRNLLRVHEREVDTVLQNPLSELEKKLWRFNARSSFAVWMRKNSLTPMVTSNDMFWKYFGNAFPGYPKKSSWDLPLYLTNEPIQVSKAKQRYAVILSALQSQCKQVNAKLLVTLVPVKMEFDGTVSDTNLYRSERIAQWFDSTSTSLGIPFYPLFSSAARLENPLSLYQSWEYHFNPKGHEFMAEQLYPAIRKMVYETK